MKKFIKVSPGREARIRQRLADSGAVASAMQQALPTAGPTVIRYAVDAILQRLDDIHRVRTDVSLAEKIVLNFALSGKGTEELLAAAFPDGVIKPEPSKWSI